MCLRRSSLERYQLDLLQIKSSSRAKLIQKRWKKKATFVWPLEYSELGGRVLQCIRLPSLVIYVNFYPGLLTLYRQVRSHLSGLWDYVLFAQFCLSPNSENYMFSGNIEILSFCIETVWRSHFAAPRHLSSKSSDSIYVLPCHINVAILQTFTCHKLHSRDWRCNNCGSFPP